MRCPFCHKELVDRTHSTLSGFIWQIYECNVQVKFTIKFKGANGQTPTEIETSFPHFKKIDMGNDNPEEYWYLPPYQVVWTGKETVVGVADGGYVSTYTRKPQFKIIFTTPERIHPDKPEKILERIRLLTLFS